MNKQYFYPSLPFVVGDVGVKKIKKTDRKEKAKTTAVKQRKTSLHSKFIFLLSYSNFNLKFTQNAVYTQFICCVTIEYTELLTEG